MRLIAYSSDALALLYFGMRRAFPDKKFAQWVSAEAFKRFKPTAAPAGSSEGLVRLVAHRMEFESVRRDAQSATLTALAGIIAKSDTTGFLGWMVFLLAAWAALFVVMQVMNVPVDGTPQMRSRRIVLIGMTIAFVLLSVSVKYLALHH